MPLPALALAGEQRDGCPGQHLHAPRRRHREGPVEGDVAQRAPLPRGLRRRAQPFQHVGRGQQPLAAHAMVGKQRRVRLQRDREDRGLARVVETAAGHAVGIVAPVALPVERGERQVDATAGLGADLRRRPVGRGGGFELVGSVDAHPPREPRATDGRGMAEVGERGPGREQRAIPRDQRPERAGGAGGDQQAGWGVALP